MISKNAYYIDGVGKLIDQLKVVGYIPFYSLLHALPLDMLYIISDSIPNLTFDFLCYLTPQIDYT